MSHDRLEQSIHGRLAELAERHRDAAALAAPGRRPMSFGGLARQVERIGRQLRRAGIGPGDRVALVMPDGPEMAAGFLSVTSVATAAPLNPAYRAPEFDFYFKDLDVRALLIPSDLESPAVAVADSREVPIVRLAIDPQSEAGHFTLDGPEASGRFEPTKGDDVALVLHTSGTTARPKMVPLTHANLCASADHIRRGLGLTETDRCLNVMPLFHIHGLVAAVLASLYSGGSVSCAPGFVATSFFDWLRDERPSWFTAVPTMHQSILFRAGEREIEPGPLRFIRSSSSALPPQVAAELERVFDVPVVEAYGMTEAAHQMCSNPVDPVRRKLGSVGPAAGPEVAIMDDAGRLVDAGDAGEVVVRGPNITSGYVNNREANEASFCGGWFRTGDLGRLDPDGFLFLSGRSKEIINRGGEKISPREVEEVLLDHADVVQAVCFAVPHSRLGEDVAAAVVLRPESRTTESELRAFAAGRLTEFKVPRVVLLVEEIPKGRTGKLQRIGLAERLGLDAAEGPKRVTHVDPRNPTEEALVRICREVLQVERLGVHDSFFDRGGDSVLALQVIARVRDRLGAELEILVFFESPTVAGMAERLRRPETNPENKRLEAALAEIDGLSDEEAERLWKQEQAPDEV